MILLHGGFSYEMLGFLGGGFFLFVVTLVFLYLWVRKTSFYRDEFGTMGTAQKVIYHLAFLVVAGFVAFVAAFVMLILVAKIFDALS